jgi:hypothetical protein
LFFYLFFIFFGEDRLPNQMKVWEVRLPTPGVDSPWTVRRGS